MNITTVAITMTNWNIPLIPRPQIGYSGEHAVCALEILTTPIEGATYYLEIKERKKEANAILLTAESDGLKVNLTGEMLGNAGIKKAQIRAYKGEQIKKSNIFEIEVKDSINAVEEVGSHYQAALEQISEKMSSKQDKLVAGNGVIINGNVISAEGGGTEEEITAEEINDLWREITL